MELIYPLLSKLLPLFIIIIVGFVFVRLVKTDHTGISKLLFYVISPVVIFFAGLKTEIAWNLLSTPALMCISASVVSLIGLKLGSIFLSNSQDKALLAYCSGASNTGYFGLPLVAAILGDDAFSHVVVIGMGMILFEFTLGFYLAARGQHNVLYSLERLIQMPHLYSFAAGLLFNLLGLTDLNILNESCEYFRGSYTLLGMMIIGIGLSQTKLSSVDGKFLFLNILCKVILFPLTTILFIYLAILLGIKLHSLELQILLLLSLTPTAANSVVFAQELKLNTSKAALAVLSSTLIALGTLPVLALALEPVMSLFSKL